MEICFADESHHRYAQEICDTIQDAAQKRGTGIARRTPEYICTRMTNGNAVIALEGDRFAGFCYIERWGDKDFVAHSIAEKSYAPDTSLKHLHLGSKDQLGLDLIKQKLDSALLTGRLS